MSEPAPSKWWHDYSRGLRASIRNNSTAYGYSILVTVNFALLQRSGKAVEVVELYAFIGGAVAAFALIEACGSNLFRKKMRGEKSEVVALGATFSIISISVSATVSLGVASSLDSWPAWSLSGFLSTSVYLLLVGAEMALAHRAEKAAEKKGDSAES